MSIAAALFDFGGVLTTSPFDAFADYEREAGLPDGLIRRINATNPDTNAWAALERSEIDLDEFGRRFEAEARDLGHVVEAAEVLRRLRGRVRPEMIEGVRRCGERLKTAMLTNNFVAEPSDVSMPGAGGGDLDELAEVMGLFDVVIESRTAGVRKPDPRFYELACEALAIEPHEAVFLDDLGVNLKPARAMGMTTIKVTAPAQALADLEAAVGFPVR